MLVPEFLFTLKIKIVDIGIICFIRTHKEGSDLPFLQQQSYKEERGRANKKRHEIIPLFPYFAHFCMKTAPICMKVLIACFFILKLCIQAKNLHRFSKGI